MHNYFVEWQCDGTLLRIHHALYMQARELARKEAGPTAPSSTARSMKGAEKGGAHGSSWLRHSKEIKGKKRHAAVDTLGLMLAVADHAGERAGSRSDRAAAQRGAPPVPFPGARHCRQRLSRCHDRCRGENFVPPAARDRRKRSDTAMGFVVLPKRWIVERTFWWLSRCRRLAKDFRRA